VNTLVTALLDDVSAVSVTRISTAVETDEKVVTTDQKCKHYSNMQTRKVLVRSRSKRWLFQGFFLRNYAKLRLRDLGNFK
jgi:hypothetical protein